MTIQAPLQHQYVEGQGRPGFTDLLAQYQRDSDAVAARPGALLDRPYGPHPRQRLDAFAAPGPARGVLLYLHAGYWQSRDKALFRWLAPAFQRRGLHVVFANYPLCPDVTLPELVQALQPCAAAAHTVEPAWAALPLAVAGHSAGGHLASEFGLDHAGLAPGRPGRVDGVWAISGIYDLEPLRHTTLNERLRLDAATAQRLSPLHRVQGVQDVRDVPGAQEAQGACVPAVWLVGAEETPAFLAQNRAMHQAWQAAGAWSACVEAPGTDHFTVLQAWDGLRDGLDRVFDDWWNAVAARHAAQG